MSGSGSLTLIGTVHRGEGQTRLEELLCALRPDHITLEMSPYALSFRMRRSPKLLERLETILERVSRETGRPRDELSIHPQVEAIRTLLALPFEYVAAARYCAATDAPLELIDSSLISARKLRRVERELVTAPNVRILLECAPQETAESARLARAMLHGRIDPAIRRAFLARRRGPEEIGERDRRMAVAIRNRLKDGKRLVHIGGWVHLVEDERKETLYERLRALEPERVLC